MATVPQTLNASLDLSVDPRLEGFGAIEEKRFGAERLLKALSWKSGLKKGFPLIVSLMGGTGTGKSTLFNSLAGAKMSEVGIRRPWTLRAVLLAHEDAGPELELCPCLGLQSQSAALLITHRDPALRRVILADTPDFDSVELANRQIADDYFVLSDVIIFVTSQEKYADLKGLEIWCRAAKWGKTALFVFNKMASEEAYTDFCGIVAQLGYPAAAIAVECLDGFPEQIPGLRERAGFDTLISSGGLEASRDEVRSAELVRLSRNAAEALEDLCSSLAGERARIHTANQAVDAALHSVERRMETDLDEVLTEDLRDRIRNRLQGLLRKYDFLFVPRMMVRTALRTAFHAIAGALWQNKGIDSVKSGEEEAHADDLLGTRSAVQLRPLEAAVADLNRRVAEFLAADPTLADLREVTLHSVPRWNTADIRSKYDAAFPGLENLLEQEFNNLRKGLSRLDELKLYSSYTLWAVLLVTAEVAVGGGFTLLDAMLDTVVFPFIPKWMLDVRIRDSLREIGRCVDEKHRGVLRVILRKQAELYKTAFSGLLPDEETFRRLERLKEDTGGIVGRAVC